jgi:hypothetical protein
MRGFADTKRYFVQTDRSTPVLKKLLVVGEHCGSTIMDMAVDFDLAFCRSQYSVRNKS